MASFSTLPILDLSRADNEADRPTLLRHLREALFDIGFLYIVNHGIPQNTINDLMSRLPTLFDLPIEERARLTKLNSPHFLGYSGFAEEKTLGKDDLREQFDFATELPAVWQDPSMSNELKEGAEGYSNLYWRLRGPNQWPPEILVPGFRQALTEYHDALARLSYRFVHLIEEAFDIPIGTFDEFFKHDRHFGTETLPQHRLKLLKYPPNKTRMPGQGVGPHKDSSGWLTFLYQTGHGNALEIVNSMDEWIPAVPIEGSFVVNFGNAFEAATQGAVRATIHRVQATSPSLPTRYSIAFFQGLPLDLTVSTIQSFIPERVRALRRKEEERQQHDAAEDRNVSTFLDPRWDNLGESQLRKWMRSHKDVAYHWYSKDAVEYYLAA